MKLFFIVTLFLFGAHSSDVLLDAQFSADNWIATESHNSLSNLPLRKFTKEELKKEIPVNYNVVDAFEKCTHVGVIPNQANCGSCWALSVAGALSDRFCIATEGEIDILLSGQDILSCSSSCKKSGSTEKAWRFAQRTGIVTGGSYDSNEGCQPYAIKPCGMDECKSVSPTPKCQKHSCTNKNYKTPFNKDIHKASKIYRLSENTEDIQREILINGPVVATFDVYEDFFNYTKGIYRWKETSGKKLGHHNVKIVGWGTCNKCGMKYWIVANTWGNTWGEEGYFKIMRETNNVGFEKKVTAGLPKLN